MRFTKKTWIFSISTIIMLAFQSCANYQLHYSKEANDWETAQPDPNLKIKHTMYLIGDAGGAEKGKPLPPALVLLNKKLDAASKNSSVVFLGDNIYPNGMAPKRVKKERESDEFRLKAQLDVLKNFKGRPFFVAGNHDWYGYGLKGLKRQQKFIENYLDNKDVFYPKPGCGDPKEIELDDQLTLILVDTHWFLTDWDGEYEINNGCELKSKEVFSRYFEEAVKGNRNKNVVIAAHHPPYSNGIHGGKMTFKQHLFPLTEVVKGLYIPFPIVGSIIQFIRSSTGHEQDIAHPNYKNLTQGMIASARKNGRFIFASGHEHALQYFEKDDQYFIVSGSGSKKSPTTGGNGAEFAYGHQGFSQLDFYEDGSSWVQFWVPNEDGSNGTVLYRKMVTGPLQDVIEEVPSHFQEVGSDTTISLSKDKFTKGFLWRALWGNHYRKAFNTPIPVATLDMEQFKGGVLPLKRGGGYQTNSLRLEGKDEKQYAMRSIDKDATRTLTYPFNQSFATNVLKDNFSASQPLAALAVPKLADAVGVYHSNPQLFYVPRQKNLDIFNDEFGDALYLIEERPDKDNWKDEASFGNAPDILGTPDMLEKILGDDDHIVDYKWTARSRLFDVVIGDWDRHDDQWRWAKFNIDGKKIYRPIPRDRDQAFSKYDGLILSVARQTSPNLKKLLVYKKTARKLPWLIYNGRHFDRTFLSGATWQDWQAAAQRIKTDLTDEVIESAFKEAWPKKIYDLDAEEIMKKLKSRRDNVDQIARKYYEFISRNVDVIGTEKRDLFIIDRLDDKQTRIRVYDTNKEGEQQDLYYERTFLAEETKKIILYGLDGDDIFKVNGTVGQGIQLKLIGGVGEDTFIDKSVVSGGGKKTLIYDAKEEDSVIEGGKETGLRLSNDPELNILNRRSLDYEFNYTTLLPMLGANPDDGFLLGFSSSYTAYGFKKEPYSSLHKLNGTIALATLGVALDYSSEFIDAIGDWEFQLNGRFQTERYSINFYGYGNDSPDPELEEGREERYNRVRQRLFSFSPTIARRLNDNSFFAFGPTFESIKVDSTDEDRFIKMLPEIEGDDFDPEIFDGLEFVGARAVLDFHNQDDLAFPSRGIGLTVDFGWKQQLDNTDKNFAFLNASFTAYQHVDANRKLILANRVGVQHRFGRDFEFYQGAKLGGIGPNSNFRGFRRDRFTGQTAFYHNIDLRWKIMSSTNKQLPFSLGILAGFDHGRVWYQEDDNDDGSDWHYSYGGGIFVSPFDIITIHLSLFRGDGEQTRFMFGGRFFF